MKNEYVKPSIDVIQLESADITNAATLSSAVVNSTAIPDGIGQNTAANVFNY